MAESADSFIPFHESVPSFKLEEMAARDLGETEELKKQCLQELRTIIREQEVACISNEDFLLRFLRYKKFDIRKSFEALRNYAHQRRLLHKKLLELRPEVLETCLRLPILGFLPYLDSENRLVFFMRGAVWNPNICPLDEALTVEFLLMSYLAEKTSSQITGIVIVCDMRFVPLSYFPHMLSSVRRWKNFSFNCVPLRYSGAHIISASAVLKFVTSVVFPFIPKKLRDRIVIHEDIGETFLEYFPAPTLPDIFGGTFGQFNYEHETNIIMDYMQKMSKEYHYFNDEFKEKS